MVRNTPQMSLQLIQVIVEKCLSHINTLIRQKGTLDHEYLWHHTEILSEVTPEMEFFY